MAGIVAYGAYVPLWRLGRETKGWGQVLERSVASYDEDSITMAVAAGLDCLRGVGREDIDAVFFASTSSPFEEKQGAALIATACDLRRDILSTDIAASLRSGTIAIKLALDAVTSGSTRKALVTAADMRIPQPRSEFEPIIGDGAAAFVIGKDNVIAEVEDFYTVSDEIYDTWKLKKEDYLRSWEDRFTVDEGYFPVLTEALTGLLKRKGLELKDADKVVYYAPTPRYHMEMARRLKVNKEQVEGTLFMGIGNTGAGFVPMALVAALETARPGERILVANYGNGADALLLRVTDGIEKLPGRRGIRRHLTSKRYLRDYDTYLHWKGLVEIAPRARRPALQAPSASALWRERDKNLRLYGSRCRKCGYPQYPPQRVCARCRAKDEMDPYRFADKKAYLFTHSNDFLAPTPDPPLIICMVNFEGGGRMMITMTDRVVEEVKVGMPLELTFRLLYVAEGTPNYYWKCMPVRD